MKALIKKHAEEGLWLDDVPIPIIGGNDVLIKVHKTAICGTDVHIYNWDAWAQKTIQKIKTCTKCFFEGRNRISRKLAVLTRRDESRSGPEKLVQPRSSKNQGWIFLKRVE